MKASHEAQTSKVKSKLAASLQQVNILERNLIEMQQQRPGNTRARGFSASNKPGKNFDVGGQGLQLHERNSIAFGEMTIS